MPDILESFNTSPRKEVVNYIRTVCRQMGVKVSFRKLSYFGESRFWDGRMMLNSLLDNASLIHTFWHEYAHFLCLKRGKYPAYHGSLPNARSKQELVKQHRAALLTAVRAEKYVESLARELNRKYCPECPSDTVSYLSDVGERKELILRLKKHLKQEMREFLASGSK
jgi:hypothetical protein